MTPEDGPVTEKIKVGTSGWSYPKGLGTWNGIFYPEGKLDELAYYSERFDTVEVNSTFYRPVYPKVAKSWARRTPRGFEFAVKAWQRFTHPKMYAEATGIEEPISRQGFETF